MASARSGQRSCPAGGASQRRAGLGIQMYHLYVARRKRKVIRPYPGEGVAIFLDRPVILRDTRVS